MKVPILPPSDAQVIRAACDRALAPATRQDFLDFAVQRIGAQPARVETAPGMESRADALAMDAAVGMLTDAVTAARTAFGLGEGGRGSSAGSHVEAAALVVEWFGRAVGQPGAEPPVPWGGSTGFLPWTAAAWRKAVEGTLQRLHAWPGLR